MSEVEVYSSRKIKEKLGSINGTGSVWVLQPSGSSINRCTRLRGPQDQLTNLSSANSKVVSRYVSVELVLVSFFLRFLNVIVRNGTNLLCSTNLFVSALDFANPRF